MSPAMTDTTLLAFLRQYWFAPPVALWRAVEARTVARHPLRPPILDLGCGHGRFATVALARYRPLAAGCDLLHHQLRVARQTGSYRTLAQADGHHLPYADATFATVLSNSVLEHIPDPSPVLVQAARVLQKGGQLVITVPSDHFHAHLAGPRAPAQAAAHQAAVDRQFAHYHYHTPDEWGRLFRRAGMDLVTYVYYMPPPSAALWDRMNRRYGIGRRSFFSLLTSPRLRPLGYQALIARWLPRLLERRLRPYYEMDPAPGETGAGLLLVAARHD